MEDTEIIALYVSRSEKAVEETQLKYGNYCRTIAFNMLRDSADAEEAVNDTYMAAWSSIPPHLPDILSSFLGRLTRNICLKKIRSSKAKKRGGGEAELIFDELESCISSVQDVERTIETRETAARISVLLRDMPDAERRVFVRRYWYFDSIESISERSGYSVSKIKSMLFRTRKKLIAQLEKENMI